MKLYLNYYVPFNNQIITLDKPVDPDMVGYDAWLQSIVNSGPKDTIFFYTTMSTDIF
jgi:hypothetical protein